MKLNTTILAGALIASSLSVSAQLTDEKLAPLLTIPRGYTVLKTSQAIQIDGKNDESAWSKAAWSEPFEDIEGRPEKRPATSTRFKLLWDDENLYVYCRFDEEHIWATLKEHDQSIFQDNALEIFIDPDGDTHNYMEFQINAFAAVWDLLLNKPPRNGGPSVTDWDIKGLKKAVFIDGTLNNPTDKDKYWGIELAFPLKTFRYGGNNSMPKVGSTWKMNVTRVQREVDVKDNTYVKRLGANGRPAQPAYSCWSVPGIVNFHYPERWGLVRFAGESDNASDFINKNAEQLKASIWKYYYLMQDYKSRKGKYPHSLEHLETDFPGVTFGDRQNLQLMGTELQFTLLTTNADLKLTISLDQDSKFVVKMLP
jgi:hypothetical protein